MKPRILITDDTIFTRAVLKNFLTSNGFHDVIEASNGQEAVDLYRQEKPALVLMDITMPIKDGISALKEIRELDPSAKVIMCSAMGQQNMILDAVRAGAVDFIVKPFQNERVLEGVQKALGDRAA
ncbi:MAG: Chemotaxis protein CheY [Fimbriimonadaceae bacterium]|nr:Chemotaxis protein CheY [Fimbriimonadaceae bacterium]